MSVKGFKLTNGTIVKYDYSALDNIVTDDTLALSGVAADAKAVGDELTDVKQDLSHLYAVTNFNKLSAGGQVYQYAITTGTTYYVTNRSNDSSVGVRTCTSDGTAIEVIKTGMAYNETVEFTATQNASYIRVYSGNADTLVSIGTNGDILVGIDNSIKSINQNVYNLSDTVTNIQKEITRDNLGLYKYEFPQDFDMVSPVTVLTDGYHFSTDFNADDYKNAGGSIWYVKEDASGSGTSRDNPASFGTAYNSASSGDTILILDGIYCRDDRGYAMTAIAKSLNIIGESENVIFVDGNYITFSKLTGYSYVYSGTRSLTSYCIDTSKDGEYIEYTKVSSIAEVEALAGSYYINGNTVYVHSINGTDPTGYVCCCLDYEPTLDISNSSQNVKVYVENITLVGKYKGITIDKTNISNTLDVCFNNVQAILCGGGSYNAFNVYGGNIIFNKCKALSAHRDGFNYVGANKSGTTCDCKAVEIDSVGASCGKGASEDTMNATTAHNGAKVIRINGKYYDCYGASVADVQTDTQSVNIACKAYAPYTTSSNSQNFSAQQSGTEMWLESCLAVGGVYDLFCYGDSVIHANNTAYLTKSIYQSATLDETHKRDVSEMMLLLSGAF